MEHSCKWEQEVSGAKYRQFPDDGQKSSKLGGVKCPKVATRCQHEPETAAAGGGW